MTTSKVRRAALKNGWRSGLEETFVAWLERIGAVFRYEPKDGVITYIKPARKARYTPDFVLPNGMIIETKGRFVTEDRQKHLLIKEQYPGLDIRFVFSNPSTRISKTSKTSYADWCEKHGFPYCSHKDKKKITEWVNESA